MKKEKKALCFVQKISGNTKILFAVIDKPRATTTKTPNYIVIGGNNNQRYKVKSNEVTEVKGWLLKEMYEKCTPAFKQTFAID